MRRKVITALAVLALIVALGAAAVATGGGSTVTRGRLERALPTVFSHLYVKKAGILGRTGVSAAGLHAKAMCDKHGPDVPDVGPGGDWVCLMSWKDPQVPMPTEGYGKFELNVHSNGCFTAIGQTKLTGFLTIPNTSGREVINPLFEFDSCFDPGADTSATGVFFDSLLSVTSTTAAPQGHGKVGVNVTCGTGQDGCAGSVLASAGGTRLGRVPLDLREEASATIVTPKAPPAGAKEVTFTFTTKTGVGPGDPVALPVEGR